MQGVGSVSKALFKMGRTVLVRRLRLLLGRERWVRENPRGEIGRGRKGLRGAAWEPVMPLKLVSMGLGASWGWPHTTS